MVLVWWFVGCKWSVLDFGWCLVPIGGSVVFDNKPRFQRKKKRFRYCLDVFENRISGFDNKWILTSIEP
jgi:hypothetical protein